MAGGVRERLLQDPVGGLVDARRERAGAAVDADVDRDARRPVALDERVERAEARHRRGDQRLDRGDVGHVRGMDQRARGIEILRDLVQCLLAATGEYDVAALGGEALRRRCADA